MIQRNSLVDCHTHSIFSSDSVATLQDAVLKTINSGLGGITFTDHLELKHEDPIGNMSFDINKRSCELDLLQATYNNNIKVLKGIEVGFRPQLAQDLSEIVKTHDFDLVICSIHTINNIFAFAPRCYDGLTKEQAYTLYLKETLDAVTMFDDFDIVGHIGYICRYAPFEDTALRYQDYQELIDDILRMIIKKDKGIEINTGGFGYNLGYTHPTFDIVKRYKELGGKIITLGSDSHAVNRIGDHFDFVVDELKAIGFPAIAHFEKRTPVFVSIM